MIFLSPMQNKCGTYLCIPAIAMQIQQMQQFTYEISLMQKSDTQPAYSGSHATAYIVTSFNQPWMGDAKLATKQQRICVNSGRKCV